MSRSSPSPPEVDTRGLVLYAVLTFSLSWAWWIALAVQGAVSRPGVGWPTHLVGLLGPAVAAVVVTGHRRGREGLRHLAARCVKTERRALWFVVAVIALGAASIRLTRLLDKPMPTWESLTAYPGAPVLPLALLFVLVLVVGGFGQEIGWRGYVVHELLPRFGVLGAAGLTWVVWAVWHLPLFWVVEGLRGMGPLRVAGWLLVLLGASIVLTALYVHAGLSVLLVAVWHTALTFVTVTPGAGELMAVVVAAAVGVFAVLIVVRQGRIF